MTDALLLTGFILAALGAEWVKPETNAKPVLMVIAAGLAAADLGAHGWFGWRWDWLAMGWLALGGCAVILTASIVYRRLWRWRGASYDDLFAGVAWAAVQQGILLGWLVLIDPVLAVVVFAALHWPNRFLVVVTLLGGTLSVAVGWYVGVSIFAAAITHGVVSATLHSCLPDSVHHGFCVGRGCRERLEARPRGTRGASWLR